MDKNVRMTEGRVMWPEARYAGRPPKVSDQQILAALPAAVQGVARKVGLERSAAYYRLRCLEAEGLVRRDRTGWFDKWRRWDDER